MFRNRRNNVLLFGSRRLFSAKKIVLTQTKWRINGMKKVGIFMADGCEEIEGLTVVDIVRRAKLEMTTISITDKKEVTSSHNVTFLTDALASEVDFDGFDVCGQYEAGRYVAAICAAPSVLGAAGLLEGRHATCHPGFEEKLTGAITSEDAVVVDGNIITSRGMGTAIDFAAKLVELLKGTKEKDELLESIVYGE